MRPRIRMGAWSPCRSPGAPTFRPVHDSCCYSGTTWSNLISAGCLPHDDFSAGSRAAGLATNVANHRPGRPDQPGRGRDDALDYGRSQCAGQAIPCRSGLINGPEGGDLATMGLDPLADGGCVHGQGCALHFSGFRVMAQIFTLRARTSMPMKVRWYIAGTSSFICRHQHNSGATDPRKSTGSW